MATTEQLPGDIPSEEVTDDAPGELAAGTPSELVPTGGGHDTEHEAGDQHTGLVNPKLGMWLFLSSDCLFFGAFIATFLLYRDRGGQKGPTPKEVFDIPFTSATSFILLMSSLTMVLALAAIQRGDSPRMRTWLMATALLGMTFIAGQVYEFTRFVQEGFFLSKNSFATSFFVLTGTHGTHVAIGILMLLSLVGMSSDGRLPPERAETVELVGLYWHFVDIVWIVIFAVVYLIPAAR